MVRPERRTKADFATVAVIVVALLVGGIILWHRSDARATLSEPAAAPAPDPPRATSVPDTLTEAWRAPSPATPEPIVAGPAAVTGAGAEVIGHDPATGQVRWRYARDIPLCTVGAEWDRAIAVYQKSGNCSEVTSLEGSDGERGPQRNSDAEPGTRLLSDGTYLTATGRKVLETWRSDLVRTQQFGIPPALKNPENNMQRPDCQYSSVAVDDGRVGVAEQCPKEAGDRITVAKAKPQDEEDPEEVFSTGSGSSESSVVTVNKTRAAVALRDRSELVVYNSSGSVEKRFPVRLDEPGPPEEMRIEETTGDRTLYWHTGRDTIALDQDSMSPLWTIPDTLGPGTLLAGKLVVPVHGGLAVHDSHTGVRERVIPVDRQGFTGRILLDSVDGVLLEQRGDTLVALR